MHVPLQVVQTHSVGLPISCLLPMPDNTLAVSMLKGQVQLFRTRKEASQMELLAILQVRAACACLSGCV